MRIVKVDKSKILISIASGVGALLLSRYSLSLDNIFNIKLIWSLVLPITISLIWEPLYAMVSMISGPVFIGILVHPNRGFINLFIGIALFIWAVTNSYFIRNNKYKKWYRIYIIQIICAISYSVFMNCFYKDILSLNKYLWIDTVGMHISDVYLRIIILNDVLCMFMIIAVSQLILELPIIRKFYKMKIYEHSEIAYRCVFISLLFIALFFMFDVCMDSIYSKSRGLHLSFVHISTGESIKISMIIFVTSIVCQYCIITERIKENSRVNVNRLTANLTAAFEGNSDAMWVINYKTKKLVFFNSSYTTLIKNLYERDVATGQDIREVMPKDKMKIWDSWIEASIRNGILYEEYETKYGEFEEVTLYPIIVENDSKNLVIFEKNVTDKKKNEKQIIELNETLEKKVEKRTIELATAYNDLESFSYTVSHELKTPIREIEAYIEIIEEDNYELLLEESRQDIKAIKTICADTIILVKQMMDYSKSGYVIMNFEKINFNELITDCIKEINKSMNNHNIRFDIQNLPEITGDRFLLKQVIFNILSNSYKFTSKIKQPEIKIWSESEGNSKCIYIKDNGVGFDSKYKEKLFKVFDKLHDESEYEGKGIGLATVQKIINRHNGKVRMISEENKGCTVILVFK